MLWPSIHSLGHSRREHLGLRCKGSIASDLCTHAVQYALACCSQGSNMRLQSYPDCPKGMGSINASLLVPSLQGVCSEVMVSLSLQDDGSVGEWKQSLWVLTQVRLGDWLNGSHSTPAKRVHSHVVPVMLTAVPVQSRAGPVRACMTQARKAPQMGTGQGPCPHAESLLQGPP